MKKALSAGAALLLTTTSALALGLDRSGQPTGVIFEDGSYVELSFGFVMPSLDGTDAAAFETGNVGEDFNLVSLGYKQQINEQTSIALIIDEPYGADVLYDEDDSVVLGGTAATVDTRAVTALVKYQLDENWSVYGGLRAQSLEAEVTLQGLAYGGISGYSVVFDQDVGYGYTLGAAYEIPDIALRAAMTYSSEIEHSLETTETGVFVVGDSADTEVTAPQAINLDFQTGIAADTLLFGSIRWADYDATEVVPEQLGASLTDLSTGSEYSIGVGRRFSDAFSGSISIGYEGEGDDDLVSPLSPTNGNTSIAIGGQYTVDQMTYSGGISYTMFGDAKPATGDPEEERADFEDNSALAVGFRVGYSF